ncbi:MAG: hypothetical protein ACRENB_03125 [Gemmatimonadales bacterium]
MTDAPSLPAWLRLAPAVIVLWVVVSWPVGLWLDPDRLTRPGELEYLLADVGILLPLSLAVLVARRRGSASASGLLAAMLGALAYDVAHFGVRTVRETSGAARAGVVAALVLLLALIARGLGILLWRSLQETPSTRRR